MPAPHLCQHLHGVLHRQSARVLRHPYRAQTPSVRIVTVTRHRPHNERRICPRSLARPNRIPRMLCTTCLHTSPRARTRIPPITPVITSRPPCTLPIANPDTNHHTRKSSDRRSTRIRAPAATEIDVPRPCPLTFLFRNRSEIPPPAEPASAAAGDSVAKTRTGEVEKHRRLR